jgi:hypothetical protein
MQAAQHRAGGYDRSFAQMMPGSLIGARCHSCRRIGNTRAQRHVRVRLVVMGHEILDRFVQASGEDAVAIMEQLSEITVAQSFPQLLQRPGCSRV